MLIRSIRRGIQRCGQSRRWLQWIPELIAGIYALASVAWIVLSDEVLISLAGDYHTYQHLQTYKGTVFVVGSALLIYGLLRVAMRQLHRSYQTVEASEARLQLALQNVNGGVWEIAVAPSGALLSFISPTFLNQFDLPDSYEAAVADWKARIHTDDREPLLAALSAALSAGAGGAPFHSRYRFMTGAGGYSWLDAWGSVVSKPGDRSVRMAGVVLDTTRQVLVEQQLEQLLRFDALTGLSRSDTFAQNLESRLAQLDKGQGVGVFHIRLVADLGTDDNETEAAILREVADRLRQLASHACLMSHLSHNDFAIATPALTQRREAHGWLNAILDRLSGPVRIGEIDHPLAFAVGASVSPQDGTTCQTLMRNANHAAVALGVVAETQVQWFTDGIDAQYQRRSLLVRDLRRAADEGEIICHFQPLVDFRRGVTAGFEALARWQKRDGTLVMPGEFIPLAEQFGSIRRIGEEVLRQSCQAASDWLRKMGDAPPPYVAVNVSPVQLASPRFPALVASILTETELPPNLLEIEVTEGVLTSDSDAVANRLRELRRLGISIAIDDFGTGYSSLSLLGRLPFTRLKIDRAFVADCLVNRDSAAIVDMIIDLSRRLELSITAEGVETADQVAWLADRGVDVVQGFYFSRPVPLALADRLTQRDWHAYLAAEAVDESGWSIG